MAMPKVGSTVVFDENKETFNEKGRRQNISEKLIRRI